MIIREHETLESLKKQNEPKIVISDMDEVLVNIVPKTIEKMQSKKEIFEKYLNIFNISISDIFNREHYYIEQWLKKDNINEIPQTVKDELFNIWKDEKFYDNLKPTAFCKALNKALKNGNIKTLYIVSKTTCNEQISSKIKWIANNFDKDVLHLIEFISVKLNENKSDIINNLNIKWDTYAEDDISNIIDVIVNSNTNCFGNEILIPKMGYNKMNSAFKTLIEGANLQVYYM